MITTEAYDKVLEFHLKYGHYILKNGVVPEDVRLLRVRLLLEELGELACAVHEANRVLIADALSDLLYVTVGSAVSCLGSPVHDHWVGSTVPNRYPLNWLTNQVAHLVSSVCLGHIHHVLETELNHTVVVISTCATTFNVPLRECFLEVHKSNMTKTVVDVAGGKKGSVKGMDYREPNLERILLCGATSPQSTGPSGR